VNNALALTDNHTVAFEFTELTVHITNMILGLCLLINILHLINHYLLFCFDISGLVRHVPTFPKTLAIIGQSGKSKEKTYEQN